MDALVLLSRCVFLAAAAILLVYAVRHYLFSFFRLKLTRPEDYSETEGFQLPSLSVIVPMHKEEAVAPDILRALIDSDYDPALLEILAVNDRSSDGTGQVIADFAAQYPMVRALDRLEGRGGKPAALKFATEHAHGEVIVIFDADYIPGPAILKMLVAPFADAQVAAVMGRVVPSNAHDSLMSGLLSLERAAGYQVNQQARFGLGLTPQFGGTVGGVRASALAAVGGWNTESLTEDTDLTCRLVLAGWRVSYVNHAECYEQVPQTWEVRRAQLRRWVIGHNECFHRFGLRVLRAPHLSIPERLDLFLVLACYWTAPVMVAGWVASIPLFLSGHALPSDAAILALLVISCQTFSSQATLLEMAAACFLDLEVARALLLPLSLLNFAASTGAVCSALTTFYIRRGRGQGFTWDKTIRYQTGRHANGNGNGAGNPGNGDAKR